MKKCLYCFKFIAILTHLLVKQATRAIRSFKKSESVIRYFLSKNELFTRKITERIPNPEKKSTFSFTPYLFKIMIPFSTYIYFQLQYEYSLKF